MISSAIQTLQKHGTSLSHLCSGCEGKDSANARLVQDLELGECVKSLWVGNHS